jgi:hypothetical protein
MTGPRRKMPSTREIERALREAARVASALRAEGYEIGAIDIRFDGVTVHPPAPQPVTMGNDFDDWKQKDKDRGAPARRQ